MRNESDIDFDNRRWRIPETKNGKPHEIYLSDFAVEHFRKVKALSNPDIAWVYPGRDRKKALSSKSITKQLGDRQRSSEPMKRRSKSTSALALPGGKWGPHDLRRTGATMMTQLHVFLWLISLMELTGQSCDVNGKKHYTFDDIKFILDKYNCNKCHYKGSYENLWIYDSYENITAQSSCGSEIIVPGNSYQSLLIDKLNGGPTSCGNAMPLGNKMISDVDLLVLESWIDIGAPEKCIPVFEQIKTFLTIHKCNLCHVDSETWSFENYNSVFIKPLNSTCEDQELIKYRAKESLLYKKISDKNVCGGPMLVDGDPMSDGGVDHIRDWINASQR